LGEILPANRVWRPRSRLLLPQAVQRMVRPVALDLDQSGTGLTERHQIEDTERAARFDHIMPGGFDELSGLALAPASLGFHVHLPDSGICTSGVQLHGPQLYSDIFLAVLVVSGVGDAKIDFGCLTTKAALFTKP
jgi:hypothetical protein